MHHEGFIPIPLKIPLGCIINFFHSILCVIPPICISLKYVILQRLPQGAVDSDQKICIIVFSSQMPFL
jgi:hypothetical protein